MYASAFQWISSASPIPFFANRRRFDPNGVDHAANKNGRTESSGHLSFDQYEQDQVVVLEQGEEGGKRDAGLTIDDRPTAALQYAKRAKLESEPDATAKIETLREQGAFGAKRAFFGKDQDRNSLMTLRDAKGRPRLVLQVTADGAASIQFLDQAGKVLRTIAAK